MRTALYAGPDIARRGDLAGSTMSTLALALERFHHWRKTRRAIRQLSTFSDAMLEDIGLTRGEIEHAVTTGRRENDELSNGW